jgi:amino acid adenylation domain-containing protein
LQIDHLSAQEKRVLLARLLQERAGDPEQRYPMSQGQRALWFLSQLAPESWAYNTLFSARILSEVDSSALRQAFQALVDRHASLRTTYVVHAGEPAQVVHDFHKVHFEQIDAAGWSSEALQERLIEESHRPFDLENGPVFRPYLFTRSTNEHILLLTGHHIAMDLWSYMVMIGELGTLYPAKKAGAECALPPLKAQYTDFVRWQSQMLAGPRGEKLWRYWQSRLAGELPVLNLPTDRLRPSVQTYHGDSFVFTLGRQLTGELKALADAERTTLYTVLLAAFQTLLYRFTEQEDILVGSPMAGRSRSGFERIVGHFVNVAVLRSSFSDDLTFRELLAQVRGNVLSALDHQDYPFSLLVEKLGLSRDPSRSPLVDVVFDYESLSVDGGEIVQLLGGGEQHVKLGDLELVPYPVAQQEGQFDLVLHAFENESGVQAAFVYNTDLFDADTIARMAESLQTLLEGISANPDQSLSVLPILPKASREKILFEWNDTQTTSSDYCVHELFEAQRVQTPDAVAVIFGDWHITYAELDARANQLACYLRKMGVRPGDRVGICMKRSVDMITGLLGILKSGGVYVPLEPTYPKDRLAFMLEDVNVKILLTQTELRKGLPDNSVHVISIDMDWNRIEQEKDTKPTSDVDSDYLAYVIYTSGSTGRPKGVAVCHKQVVNVIEWVNKTFDVGQHDRLFFVTSVGFDLSVYDIFGILAAGGAIQVADESCLRDPERLLYMLCNKCITFWDSAPAALQQIVPFLSTVEPGWRTDCLRLVFLSGDWLPLKLPDTIRSTFSNARVVSLGGATEATIWSNYYPIEHVDPNWVSIPYGKPIQNARYHVLDSHLTPCPIGVAGDLYIGGDCLALGYANRASLTAERFIPDPFSGVPGALLYKTGDVARYWVDGNLEFLGRLDHQVKIRGFRVELGEIEAVLAQHPAVRDVVVLARGNGEEMRGASAHADRRLVAYLVCDEEEGILQHLRGWVRERLPEYMEPTAFVMLDALPLTSNGKVDRRALPEAELSRSELHNTYLPPRTLVEHKIADVWEEILGVSQVGIGDNFFKLGGNSLSVTQMVSHLRGTFEVDLPLRTVFESPTIESISRCIETASQIGKLQENPIEPISRDQVLPLSFAQQRLWFLNQLEPDSAFYNIPASVRLVGKLDVASLARALNEVVRRHEVLRTSFREKDGLPYQSISFSLKVPLPVIDLQEISKEDLIGRVQRLAEEEAQRPFDLARDSLIRVNLIQLNNEEHVLFLTMHHIIADGWSIGILVRELATLYSAFSLHKPSPLPDLLVQYVDFAAWQRDWLSVEVLETQLAYWKDHLAGIPDILALPTDHPRPPVQTFRGSMYSFSLSQRLSTAIKKLGEAESVTLFMTMLAAFKVLLYRHTGQSDIAVGFPIANRSHKEIEHLIGFFANTLVLRTEIDGNSSFLDLLRLVREGTLEAYAHQDLPFERLVEALQPERSLSHTPLFQVMFVEQETPFEASDLPGLMLSSMQIQSGTAKFDLTMFVEDGKEGITGSLEYNTDLFEASTIARMVDHFQVLLESIVADPTTSLSNLALMTEAERQQVLIDWNRTVDGSLTVQCVHELFEAQVEKTPDSVAAVFEDQHITYDTLNRHANQLARYLRELGVRADTPVALYLDRSLSMILSVLGILKSGGCYLPLDPNYPHERLTFMLRDALVPVLISCSNLQNDLPEYAGRVVCLDSVGSVPQHMTEGNPFPVASSMNAAYVIYTSGSTGAPKGVVMPHRPLVNLVRWQGSSTSIDRPARTVQFASLNFDVSCQEMFFTWYSGGTLVLLTEDERRDVEMFIEFLCRVSAERLFLPFVALQNLAYAANSKPAVLPKNLCEVITAGEQLQITPYVGQFFAMLDWCTLHNQYGPTESHVVTAFTLAGGSNDWTLLPPIGRPITNARIYILDESLFPVPIGVTGELYIGGPVLARGYLNRPALTAERFVPDPFAEPGARLYKSGDLARYLPDGNIEFLGRVDHQVKVRGFRVELGEIESILGRHQAVQAAVATVVDDVHGDRRLVAYVIPKNGSQLEMDELQHFLRESVPEYMIPSAFTSVEEFPLTPSGKVNRQALPEPTGAEISHREAFVPPRTPLERELASLFSQVLHIESVGIDDNFFDLGGHSLIATQLISRLNAALHVELPLRVIFERPTIAGLAEMVVMHQLKQVNENLLQDVLDEIDSLSEENVRTLLES